MIQSHGPSFGFRSIAGALLGREIRVQDLEDAYAERAGCPGAVWLPSARAGICWSLRAAIAGGTSVLTPAFTCPAVHEAVVRSGGKLEPVDAAESGFLVDPNRTIRGGTERRAVVLSAIYGHAGALFSQGLSKTPGVLLRVWDMAMSAPEWGLLNGLGERDFAVISFSRGKCMDAESGAIGLTRDLELAREVRRLRDAALSPGGSKLLLARLSAVTLRTLLTTPWINSVSKRVRSHRPKNAPASPVAAGIPKAWLDVTRFEGAAPSTRVDRGLALRNLIHADPWKQKRLDLAQRYARNLAGAEGIVLPEFSPQALSHFTIRVPASARTLLRQRLYDAGIGTSTLWRLPPGLNPDQLPNAHRLSLEVVNLPLSVTLLNSDVDRICDVLRRSTDCL
ncbi:MAG: DegT/DnrJ/EryC1/StrS aminotransferase family protein [Verrucomicrobiales bacterium]|nr:DegT/DnrJ/EryC1/StrS aminotransferase family protein [Verrucomicrobiales bacterium]